MSPTKPNGFSIRILLAEISNWTGKVLVAPRSRLDQLSKREEARRTGVYLLVGPYPDDPSRALAYIGEGDNVFKRLQVTPRTRPHTGSGRKQGWPVWSRLTSCTSTNTTSGQARECGSPPHDVADAWNRLTIHGGEGGRA